MSKKERKMETREITILDNGTKLIRTTKDGVTTTRFEGVLVKPTTPADGGSLELPPPAKSIYDNDYSARKFPSEAWNWWDDEDRRWKGHRSDGPMGTTPGSAQNTGKTYGMPSGYQPYTGLPGISSGYTKKSDVGIVRIVDSNGLGIAEKTVDGWDADWWAKACLTYAPEPPANGGLPIMKVPEGCVTLTEESLKFFPCTFTATERYMESRWGRRLDDTDKDWLARHPLATDDGIPMEYTVTAIWELVQPYGLTVSRVRLRAGAFMAGDEVMKWMLALGCNPMAMVDHKTSNAAYAAQTNMPLEEVEKLFRLEFFATPLPMSIIGERGSGFVGGTGNQGGHARYLPPRGGSGDWLVSVQLAPTEQVAPYMKPPECTPYKPRRGKLSFSIKNIKNPEGGYVDIAVKGGGPTVGGFFSQPQSPAPSPQADGAGSPEKGESGTQTPQETALKCLLCGKVEELVAGSLCCETCWADAWSDYKCPTCNTKFSPNVAWGRYPQLIVASAAQGMEPSLECPNKNCIQILEFGSEDDKLNRVKATVFAYESWIASGKADL